MLTRPTTAEEVVNPDGLLDLFAATARQAIKDYTAGPLVVGPKHFDTAERFLRESGLMSRIETPPAHASTPRQLALFDERRRER